MTESHALTTRQLGSTDLELTVVGLGAWAFAGEGWAYGLGPQDDSVSIATILNAVDRGVNWIDTAALYGLGHSEEVIGRALREIPVAQRPFVFTKCGMIPDRTKPFDHPERSLRPASIRNELDASLKRLGVEQIDLYQFHWPDCTDTPIEESWGEVLRLIEDGKIRTAGVCNFDIPLLERAEATHHIDSLQPPFSMIRRGAAVDVIPWAVSHRVGVIVYSPLQTGLFTDTFSAERVSAFDEGDMRRHREQFTEPQLSRNLELLDVLRPIAYRHQSTVSAVAVAWTLAWPGVTAAIVGARTPEQLDGWVGAGSLHLNDEDLNDIAHALARLGVGFGPLTPHRSLKDRSGDTIG